MAGVLEMIRWPQKMALVGDSSSVHRVNRRLLELQTAKEILAEIFGVKVSDVEEMIQRRFNEVSCEENCYNKAELWPREFVVGE
jgi:predicted metallopeptidase